MPHSSKDRIKSDTSLSFGSVGTVACIVCQKSTETKLPLGPKAMHIPSPPMCPGMRGRTMIGEPIPSDAFSFHLRIIAVVSCPASSKHWSWRIGEENIGEGEGNVLDYLSPSIVQSQWNFSGFRRPGGKRTERGGKARPTRRAQIKNLPRGFFFAASFNSSLESSDGNLPTVSFCHATSCG